MLILRLGFPSGAGGKESACSTGDARDSGSIPGSGRFFWRRKWQLTPVFLPGEFHRQRSLVGYSPWGHKELDMIEHTQHNNLKIYFKPTGNRATWCLHEEKPYVQGSRSASSQMSHTHITH